MPRWDWTWEEPGTRRREQPTPGSPTPGGQPSPDRSRRFRRRRAAAGLVLVLVVVVVVSLLHHGSHAARHRAGRTAARQPVVHLTPAETHALTKQAEERAINHVLSYTPAVVEGGTKGNEVSLTFDDGPGPYTQQLVATLNKLHVQATFFTVGIEERYFSAGTLAELRSGDVVGDHTETHPMLAQMSASEQHKELIEPIYRIQLLGGPTPRLFRPPYGSFNAVTYRELRRLHLLMILWSTDTSDFTLPGAEVIAQRALAGAHPGAIILMHDAGGDRSQTIAALPAIVRGLRARGLRPVTVPRLLLDDPPPPGQPIPKSLEGG